MGIPHETMLALNRELRDLFFRLGLDPDTFVVMVRLEHGEMEYNASGYSVAEVVEAIREAIRDMEAGPGLN